jgi:hypothetical protein
VRFIRAWPAAARAGELVTGSVIELWDRYKSQPKCDSN